MSVQPPPAPAGPSDPPVAPPRQGLAPRPQTSAPHFLSAVSAWPRRPAEGGHFAPGGTGERRAPLAGGPRARQVGGPPHMPPAPTTASTTAGSSRTQGASPGRTSSLTGAGKEGKRGPFPTRRGHPSGGHTVPPPAGRRPAPRASLSLESGFWAQPQPPEVTAQRPSGRPVRRLPGAPCAPRAPSSRARRAGTGPLTWLPPGPPGAHGHGQARARRPDGTGRRAAGICISPPT